MLKIRAPAPPLDQSACQMPQILLQEIAHFVVKTRIVLLTLHAQLVTPVIQLQGTTSALPINAITLLMETMAVKTILMRLALQKTNARQELALMLTLDVPLVFAPPPLNVLLAQTVLEFHHATLGSTAMLASVLQIAPRMRIVKAGKHAIQVVNAKDSIVPLRTTVLLETLSALVTTKEQSTLCVTRNSFFAQLAATLSQE